MSPHLQPVAASAQQGSRALDRPHQPVTVSGEYLRREILGMGKRQFYALVKAGRLAHLVAMNRSTNRRTFYVRDRAVRWATETAPVRLRVKASA